MDNQIAVITGSAQGIGHAVAKLLSERGAKVVSWDINPINGDAMAELGGLAMTCDQVACRQFWSTALAFRVRTSPWTYMTLMHGIG